MRGCGMDIAVHDGRMVGVRGRRGDRVNHGRLGPKGLFGWQANHSPDRLTQPLVRRNGVLEPASWDDAMMLVVERTRDLLHEHRPLALGYYNSGQLFLEGYYTLGVVVRAGLGSPHLDGNTRLCTATSGRRPGRGSRRGARAPARRGAPRRRTRPVSHRSRIGAPVRTAPPTSRAVRRAVRHHAGRRGRRLVAIAARTAPAGGLRCDGTFGSDGTPADAGSSRALRDAARSRARMGGARSGRPGRPRRLAARARGAVPRSRGDEGQVAADTGSRSRRHRCTRPDQTRSRRDHPGGVPPLGPTRGATMDACRSRRRRETAGR
jgi:hypothetical protein